MKKQTNYEMENALRYKDQRTGETVVVKRRDPSYSSALFLAEEIYLKGEWKPYG